MWWKCQYDQSSSDHGTLTYFRNRLNRIAVTKEPKKDVDACIDLIYTVAKGHFLACACDIFGVASLDQPIDLPAGILNGSRAEQLAYISNIAEQVVDRCSLVDAAFIVKTVYPHLQVYVAVTAVHLQACAIVLQVIVPLLQQDSPTVMTCTILHGYYATMDR